jgi:hypothetical protein
MLALRKRVSNEEITMDEIPQLADCVPFPTIDDVKWKGKVVEFTPDIFTEIPELVCSDEISAVNRNRFVSFGLIDNVVLTVSEESSFLLGQWIMGCFFQKNYPHYTIQLTGKKRGLEYIRLVVAEEWYVRKSLDMFSWNPKNSEQFLYGVTLQRHREMGFRVTNLEDDWFTMEHFHERNVLTGFDGIEGGLLAAEFFLNFGANKEQINYDVLYHLGEPPHIAKDWSCEMRVELSDIRADQTNDAGLDDSE